MTTIKVTKLEKLVLEALAKEMYAEFTFSDVDINDMVRETKLSANVLRGVASSLIKKGFLMIDDNGCTGSDRHYIWYLDHEAQTLVPHWIEDYADWTEDTNTYEFVAE